MRRIILEALRAKYERVMKETAANIEIYLRNPNGIGEHSEVLEAIDIQHAKLMEAHEKSEALKEFKNS